MLIPSIDIMNGDAVQLVGGKTQALNAGDPMAVAQRFGRIGSMAVIDLDAALQQGNNSRLIEALVRRYRCRVGGGIRNIETALHWLNCGAEQIIIGTAATTEFLKKLPKQRTIVALDAVDGEVVVEGWRSHTGRHVIERMTELAPYVAGFLVTFVECEGRLQGTHIDQVEQLVDSCQGARLTIAGGITTAKDVASLDRLGVDAQVGMALYTERLGLADGFAAPLKSDRPDGLWPTVIVDQLDRALGLCYSNIESLRVALRDGIGAYWSRRRGLWIKGQSSGNTQRLIEVATDCDRDSLRFTVDQSGSGFCHLNQDNCWGNVRGLAKLERTVRDRLLDAPSGSYTKRLYEDSQLLNAKLVEEAQELAHAVGAEEVVREAADLLYFSLVAMGRHGIRISEVASLLDQRALVVTRRPGNAKTQGES